MLLLVRDSANIFGRPVGGGLEDQLRTGRRPLLARFEQEWDQAVKGLACGCDILAIKFLTRTSNYNYACPAHLHPSFQGIATVELRERNLSSPLCVGSWLLGKEAARLCNDQRFRA